MIRPPWFDYVVFFSRDLNLCVYETFFFPKKKGVRKMNQKNWRSNTFIIFVRSIFDNLSKKKNRHSIKEKRKKKIGRKC